VQARKLRALDGTFCAQAGASLRPPLRLTAGMPLAGSWGRIAAPLGPVSLPRSRWPARLPRSRWPARTTGEPKAPAWRRLCRGAPGSKRPRSAQGFRSRAAAPLTPRKAALSVPRRASPAPGNERLNLVAWVGPRAQHAHVPCAKSTSLFFATNPRYAFCSAVILARTAPRFAEWGRAASLGLAKPDRSKAVQGAWSSS